MRKSHKDPWEKADVVLKPVGGLLTALAVGWLGLQGRDILESRQRQEAKTQLYAQLMSAREQADSSLRQSMFNTIIDDFLAAPSATQAAIPEGKPVALAAYEREVLKLEVLAYNFHDALDLAPLFKDVHRRLSDESSAENKGIDPDTREALIDRVQDVAVEVTYRQVAALEDSGEARRPVVDRRAFEDEGIMEVEYVLPSRLADEEDEGDLPGRRGRGKAEDLVERSFKLEVHEIDAEAEEVLVRLGVWDLDENGEEIYPAVVDLHFWVGYFDFPMIDNTRLAGGDRCAVVLTELQPDAARLILVYFPGSRASLKQKPYYDEIIDRTLRLSDEQEVSP